MTNIKLKMTGFHALIVIEPFQLMSPTNNNKTSIGLSSTSAAAEPPSSPNYISYALPPARILCTFMDGGVGLYDLGKRKWNFLREMVSLLTMISLKVEEGVESICTDIKNVKCFVSKQYPPSFAIF